MKFFSEKPKTQKSLWSMVNSFSKWITVAWLFVWVETILFSQLATMFSFGDALSIQSLNDNIREIGIVICGAYFGAKTFENIAQGYEKFKLEQQAREIKDGSDDDVNPVIE